MATIVQAPQLLGVKQAPFSAVTWYCKVAFFAQF